MKKAILFFVFVFVVFKMLAVENVYDFLIGTYTKGTSSKGIYTVRCDMNNAKFDLNLAATDLSNPSFLALSEDKNFVYAVSESGDQSKVYAFTFDAISGKLNLINKVAAGDLGPCHISMTEKHIVTANYSGGSICVFNREMDGSLSEVAQKNVYTGRSIDSTRQTQPHLHQTVFSNDEKVLLVNDLGTDLVRTYLYDKDAKVAILTALDSIKVKLGSGPRHTTMSEDGRFAFVLSEMDGTITTMAYNAGKLTKLHETSIVRKSDIKTGAADIHISPDAKFLYATNRGTANDITCFSIGGDGALTFVEQTFVLGVGPRNFAITKDGKYIFIGNQGCSIISIFKRDLNTGKIEDTGKGIDVGAPVCILEY